MNKRRLFDDYILQLKKGLRKFALYTINKSEKKKIEDRLKKEKIPYLVYTVKKNNINVFFGNALCVEIIKTFGEKNLNDYTAEEDFMLGIMLGYGLIPQAKRYLKYKK